MKAFFKLCALVMWIGLCCLPAWLCKAFKKDKWRDAVVRGCYLGILRILGVQLDMIGTLGVRRPLMIVSNHVSYLDIALLGSCAPVRFTPKIEMARWPVLGGICRLCDTVFVERRAGSILGTGEEIRAALQQGHVVSLFPEATTGNGLALRPFKSSFFSLGEEKEGELALDIQPVAIRYTHIRRLPIDTTQWPQLAWYGDMELLPHLWNVLQMGSIRAELVFLSPVSAGAGMDRKQLSDECRRAIIQAMESRETNAWGRQPKWAELKAAFSRSKS